MVMGRLRRLWRDLWTPLEDMPDNVEGAYLGPRERPPPGVRKAPFEPFENDPEVVVVPRALHSHQPSIYAFFKETPDDSLRSVIAVANFILWEREQQRENKAEPPFHH